jgi:hypothetical protein
MKIFKSVDFLIIIVVLLLFLSGFSIYAINRDINSSFYIQNVKFTISEDKGKIDFYISVEKGNIELNEVIVDDISVDDWSTDKIQIGQGEKAHIILNYNWTMNKDYSIGIETTDGRQSEIDVRAPEIEPTSNLVLSDVNVSSSLSFLSAKAPFKFDGQGVDSIHMLLFTYLSFEESNRPIYLFYDQNYLSPESVRRSDAIINYFNRYNLTVNKLYFDDLMELSKFSKALLIIVNPLKDQFGRRLENAMPAPLIDPNGDGYIKNDSKYGRSILYDMMKDEGMVLVTVSSLEPYKRIVYKKGVYVQAKDSLEPFDAHMFFTDASGEESIINGSFTIGKYNPSRISGSLGLSFREGSFGFDRDAMNRYNIQYYDYGDYQLASNGENLNLAIPVFIKVGEGGWLAMGDEEFWLSDEQIAHDLFLIYMQSIWDSRWISHGWYYDSGSAFHSSLSSVMSVEGELETEKIPKGMIGDTLSIRVVGIIYSSDIGKGSIKEMLIKQKLK